MQEIRIRIKYEIMQKRFLIIFSVFAFLSSSVFAQSEPVAEAPEDTIVAKHDLAKNAECFSKGLEAKYNENYPVAIMNFEKALKFFNDDDASMYELSALYLNEGRKAEALSMIQQAASLQPDNKWYQIRLADTYLQNSDYHSFMNIYDKLLLEEPDNLDYLETYIDVLLRIGDYNKVIEKLDTAERLYGRSEIVYQQKIQIYGEQGKIDKAIEELEKLVDFIPDNTRYRAMLAEAYRKVKRDKEAYQQYLKIKELDPDDKYVDVSLMDYYQSVGNRDKAFEEFVSAVNNENLDYDTKAQLYNYVLQNNSFYFKTEAELDSKMTTIGNAFIEKHPDKPLGYYTIGSTYQSKGQYDTAKEYYLTSLSKDANDNMVYLNLLNCCEQLKQYDDQILYSNKALELYPTIPIFYVYNGLGYYNVKDYENCIKAFEKARKFVTENNLIVLCDSFIGDSYFNLNNHTKAYEAYDRVLRINPDDISVMNNYAYYLSLDNQDLDRALQMSEKTIKAEPKNATYLDTYAWILYKLGRYKEAKKYMEKVFKYDKNPQGVNYEHYGDILYKAGDTKNALKNWKKAKKAGGEVSEFLDKKINDEKLYE